MYYKRNVPKEFQSQMSMGRAKMMEKEMTESVVNDFKGSENEEIKNQDTKVEAKEKNEDCKIEACDESKEESKKCDNEEEKMFSRENYQRDNSNGSSFLPIILILLLVFARD